MNLPRTKDERAFLDDLKLVFKKHRAHITEYTDYYETQPTYTINGDATLARWSEGISLSMDDLMTEIP